MHWDPGNRRAHRAPSRQGTDRPERVRWAYWLAIQRTRYWWTGPAALDVACLPLSNPLADRTRVCDLHGRTFAKARICRAYAFRRAITARRRQVWLPNSRFKETRAACRVRRDGSVTKPPVGDLRRLEIVGRHTVEEFLELLDLVLTHRPCGFLVVLVGNQQPCLGEHRLLDIDRDTHAQRDGHRIRRPSRHLDVAVENQVRVEGALLQVDNADLFERMSKCGNEIS